MKSHLLAFLVAFSFLCPVVQAQQIPGVRAHHGIVYDPTRGKILLSGGSTPLNGGTSFVMYDDLWSYDGKGWKKEIIDTDGRSGITLAYDSKNKILLSMGGFRGNASLGDLRKLENKKWKTLTDVPEMAAAEGGFVYDESHDNFVSFGGSLSRGVVNATTRLWDGKSWTAVGGVGPEGRQAFAMVYDSKRNRTVIFGGMGETPEKLFGDTWEFDGTTWTKVSTSGPEARMAVGYTYDSSRGLLLIFGGATKSGLNSETWSWDGKEWKQLSTTGPSPRVMGYMAYDAKRDKTVLFGGRLGWPNDANDTWEWDGTSWKFVVQ